MDTELTFERIRELIKDLPQDKQDAFIVWMTKHYVGWYPSPVCPPKVVIDSEKKFKYKIF